MGSIIMSVTVLAIGVALGLARGGRLEALRSVRPRWSALLLGGFALQAFAENVDITGATSLSVIGMFALVVGLAANASIRGALIAALGVTMNLFVLVINGAVPIRFEALGDAGLVDAATQRSQITSVGHLLELETADTRLGALGDTIPIGLFDSVISIGDLVTFAGVVVIVSSLVAARRTVGVDVDAVFAPVGVDVDVDVNGLQLDAGLEAMFGVPESDAALSPGVLDIVAAPAVIDVSSSQPEPLPADPIDLTFDADDLWADDDGGVRILGPSTKSNG